MSEVINRAGRAGEMKDVVHLAVDLDRLGYVVLDKPEFGSSTSPAMLRRAPVSRLSTQITSSPSPRKRSQRCEPMNPAPPVMTVLNDRPPA